MNNAFVFWEEWWGMKDVISPGETALRGIAMFLFFLIVLRLAGMRSFSKGSVFDNLTIILLGSILGRGITGGTPFFSALLGGLAVVAIHKLISRFTFHSSWAGRYLKGKTTLLYEDGQFRYESMKQADISENDIMEELRITCHCNSLQPYSQVWLERSGRISFIKKDGR